MTLTEFLLARIAEDEGWLPDLHGVPPFGEALRRAFAECERDRRIVELHSEARPAFTTDVDGMERNDYDACGEDGDDKPCPTLRLLALPYADHPDYREEWKP